jgi:hypothetical protein
MVSGLVTSPNDHSRIVSGEASLRPISVNCCGIRAGFFGENVDIFRDYD